MCPVPTLETSRLKLRAHSIDDLPAAINLWSDPDVLRHTIGRPSSRQEVWMRILRYSGHWALLGFGYWAVEEKASGTFIGELGFADFKRDLEPSRDGEPELGWALLPAFHGKGYATEALLEALAWGDRVLESRLSFCIVNPENQSSLRVAEKIGYKEVQRIIYNGQGTVVLERALKP